MTYNSDQFSRIALIARTHDAKQGQKQDYKQSRMLQHIEQLYQLLLTKGKTVFFDQQTAEHMHFAAHASMPASDLASRVDIGMVFGGDGRLLEMAPCFAEAGTPLLGINYGRLGFLADISADSLQPVMDVLAGRYFLEQRLLIEVKVQRGSQTLAGGIALNDVVLHATISKMIEFELYINQKFVYSQRSDGIIVATPTGSTAYALSAGGPIIQPDLDVLTLVPNSAHTLTSRPIVIQADSEIKIRVGHPPYPIVSCDGQTKIRAKRDDLILISKYPSQCVLVHPHDYDFYATCRTKLDWGKKLGTS